MCCVNHASLCLYANDNKMYNKNENGMAKVFKNGRATKVSANHANCGQYFLTENPENFKVNNFILLTINHERSAIMK